MDRKFEILDALGDVNTYFVEEATPNSPQMKDSFKAKLSTIAASVAFVTVIGALALLTSRFGGVSEPGDVGVGPGPGSPGGDVYAAATEDTKAVDDDIPIGIPFTKALLSEMTDEELLMAIDAVTSETRYADNGSEYLYSLLGVVNERFSIRADEERAKNALVSAVRAVAACDETATDDSFFDDIVGADEFIYYICDINSDDIIDGISIDGSNYYDTRCYIPVSELCAVLDMVVMRYYLEYYDVYADGGVITPALIERFASVLDGAGERFEYGARDLLWPGRLFEPIDISSIISDPT